MAGCLPHLRLDLMGLCALMTTGSSFRANRYYQSLDHFQVEPEDIELGGGVVCH